MIPVMSRGGRMRIKSMVLIAASIGGSMFALHSFAEDAAQNPTIEIGNFTFAPANVTVKAGSRLTWVNKDDVPHTVLGADPGSPLRSAAMDTDDRYSVVMQQPGTYKYFCSVHPHMVGVVIVK